MDWIEIRVKLPDSLRDAVSNHLFELGAQGVAEDGEAVKGFFDRDNQKEALAGLGVYLRSLRELHPKITLGEPEVSPIQNQNWADEYKKHYAPQKISGRFFLVPVWQAHEVKVPSGFLPILMEPGQAFGTGLHPTTQLTLKVFESVIEDHPNPTKQKLIDVGTGSGILAIAAEKLGLSEVVALDNDPVAVEVAVENVKLNHCKHVSVSDKPLSHFKTPYNIVLSNILLETHRELITEYKRLLFPSGFLIVSGLLGHQQNELMTLFKNDFRLIGSAFQQEWAAYCFTHSLAGSEK